MDVTVIPEPVPEQIELDAAVAEIPTPVLTVMTTLLGVPTQPLSVGVIV